MSERDRARVRACVRACMRARACVLACACVRVRLACSLRRRIPVVQNSSLVSALFFVSSAIWYPTTCPAHTHVLSSSPFADAAVAAPEVEGRAQLVPAAQIGVSPFCAGVEVAETTPSPSRPECARGPGETRTLRVQGYKILGSWLRASGLSLGLRA